MVRIAGRETMFSFCIICLLILLMLLSGDPVRSDQHGAVISFDRSSEIRYKQSFNPPKSGGNPSHLQPMQVERGDVFSYTYDIGRDLSLAPDGLNLRLSYRDSEPSGRAGLGWRLRSRIPTQRPLFLDLLEPGLPVSAITQTDAFVTFGTQEFQVSAVAGAHAGHYTGTDAESGVTIRFAPARLGDHSTVVVTHISRAGKSLAELTYRGGNIQPVLCSLLLSGQTFTFTYKNSGRDRARCPASGPLHQITTTQYPGNMPARFWTLSYAETGDIRHLTELEARVETHAARTLQFAYRNAAPNSQRADTRVPSSMWREVRNDPRFLLPRGLTIENAPGLRFMDLNRDKVLDIVQTRRGKLNAWVSKSANGGWIELGDRFAPRHPSLLQLDPPRLSGGHYNGLVKLFAKSTLNTFGFSSFLVSYYEPTEDRKSVQSTKFALFPNVPGGKLKLQPGGDVWTLETADPLQLPVPLQFEGAPWPTDQPGVAAVERADNQGAQFVNFFSDGRPGLLYIGERYTDILSGDVLPLATRDFRDTGNCNHWFQDVWENLGEKRTVKVDLCQAVWVGAQRHWHELFPKQFPGQPFWIRVDLHADGKPNGKFTLPALADRGYYEHYKGFRNIAFARLDRDPDRPLFMLVQANRSVGNGPRPPAPLARDLYVMENFSWRKVERGDGFLPPSPFFERFKGIFMDVNGDRLDDAISAVGAMQRKTWINTGKRLRWKDSPEYYLPRRCHLDVGSCRFLDLDGDGDQDLFVSDGRLVYLNQTLQRVSGITVGAMTHFTDGNGKVRSVETVGASKNSNEE